MNDTPSTLAELLDALDEADDNPAARLTPLKALRTHPDLAQLGGAEALRAAQALAGSGALTDLPGAADLAWRAHLDGVDEAGLLFAMSTDRYALMSGRAQRFGTITMEHQGEIVLAPIDPTTPDSLREELGIPPVDVIRERVTEHNRDRARQRAAQSGVPRGPMGSPPFCRIWRDPTADELRQRMAAEGAPVWADGDELTVVSERSLVGALVGPLFEVPMWQVDDLWVLTLRVDRLAEAVFTYAIWPLNEHGQPAFASRPDPDGRFRGVDAPPAAPTRSDDSAVTGTVIHHAFESTALGEPRNLTIYRPPGHTASEALPVVYATDGGMVTPYFRRLDAAIEAGLAPRVVVVAADSARFDPQVGNKRAMEYLPGFDPAIFDAHRRFFTQELPAWAEAELGVSSDPDQRAVFGCSDGGGHALSVGIGCHDRFRHVIAYSSGMPPNGDERWAEGAAPYIQLCAGTLEPQFFLATEAWAGFLSMTGVEHHWTERVCGHELLQWIEEFPKAVARAFGDADR